MDQAFLLRARRLLEQSRPICLDHGEFAALAVARQAATPTAQAQGRCAATSACTSSSTALASLLLAEPCWPKAAAGQVGCFNRAVAVRRVNTR